MIEIAQGTVEQLAASLGVARRFAARLGALAARGLRVSRALAEEAKPGSSWETLLACRDWLDAAPEVALERVAAMEPFSDLLRDWPLVLLDRDGVRILVFADEVEAEAAAPSPSLPTPSAPEASPCPDSAPGTDSRRDAFPALRAAPAVSAAAPEAAAATSGVPADTATLEALRVSIFAGATPEEKMAALRRLAFLDCRPGDKIGLFLQTLAEADAPLRSAAAQGLATLGLDADLAAAARLLADGGPDERVRAADRLADLAADADDLGRGALLAALLGALRASDADDEAAGAVLSALARSAPALGAEALRREAVLQALLEGLLSASGERRRALPEAVAAVDAVDPGWAARRLVDHFLRSGSADYRARLLPLFAGLPLDDGLRAALLPAMADLALDAPADSEACRRAEQFILDQGPEGFGLLADRLAAADTAHQRHLVRTLDNALRTHPGLDAAVRTRAARAALSLFRGGARSVRIDLLETRLAMGPELDTDVAEELAAVLSGDLADYAHWRLLEQVEDVLSSLGPGAAGPLTRRLREGLARPETAAAVAALGRVGAALAAEAGFGGLAGPGEILRTLTAAGLAPSPCRDAVHTAMGRVAGAPGVPAEVNDMVFRTLWQRLDGTPGDHALIDGLGFAAAGSGASAANRRRLADGLIRRWNAPTPSATMRRVLRDDGEEAFDFGGDLVPAARCWSAVLDALARLALSASAEAPLRGELVAALLEGWLRAGAHDFAWGPANAARLTETLGRLGADAGLDDATRVRIAHTLARRAGDPTAVSALTTLLAAGGGLRELDALAGALTLRILKTLGEGTEMGVEDREFWLAMLGRLGLYPRLEVRGGGGERIRERLVEALATGLRAGLWSCRRHLTALRASGVLAGRALERAEEELSRTGRVSRHRS